MRVAIILTVAASASAANLRHYTGYNCGGGFAECVDVGSSTCCTTPYLTQGSPSVAVVYTNPYTRLIGYQATRDNWCGSVANQRTTEVFSFGCLSYEPFGAGTFAGTAWFPPAQKRESEVKCTGSTMINRVVLNDGHQFGLEGLDEAAKAEWFSFLTNGSTTADLPDSFAALEQEKEGVVERLNSIQG